MSAAQSAAVLQVSGAVAVTSATVPPVADRAIEPVASGAGSSTVPPAPLASATRYRLPASTEPVSGVTCHWLAALALAGRYWTLHPASDTGAEPRLASSTKSWVSVAPELPPPP